MKTKTVLALQVGAWASLVAFQKLYVYKDYPKMDPYQQYVMKAVYQNPNITVAVHLKWLDGSTSMNRYTYSPPKHAINIESDSSFLFSDEIPVSKLLTQKWSDWVKQPEKLLRWQLWPAKIYRIEVLSKPVKIILDDNAILEAKEPTFACRTSDILRESLELQKVRNEHVRHVQMNLDAVRERYELFLRTIAWSIYQRTKPSLVLFVKQLFFYLRAQNVDYKLMSHFWLGAFAGPNGVPLHLNCLGITSLLCAIMECFGFFPETFACRIVHGHAVLVYRVNDRQPWKDLELSVPNDETLNWLGVCEWVNYGNRQNYIISSANDLVTAMAYNALTDLSPMWDRTEYEGYKKDLMRFLVPEGANIHQKLAAQYFLQQGQLRCAEKMTSADFQEFVQDFMQRSDEYLPGYVLIMVLCADFWKYVKATLSASETKDLYAKLRQNEYFTSAKYLWQIQNPLQRYVGPKSIPLMASWRSHLPAAELENVQNGWSQVWDIARGVMESPRAPANLLKKRTAPEAAPTGTSSLTPKYPRLPAAPVDS